MYRPSNSHRWLECTLSPKLEGGIPELPPSSYAIDGTFAHFIADFILRKKIKPSKISKLIGKEFEFEYESCEVIKKEKRILTAEVLMCVKDYIDFIYKKTKYKNVYSETKLKINKHVEGTCDCHFLIGSILYVVDYKHGAGVDVKVKHNSQLLIYGLGAYIANKDKGIKKIKLIIIQPRTTGFKDWVIKKKELLVFKKLLNRKLKEIHENPLLKTGTHCKWCKAEPYCLEKYLEFSTLMDSDIRKNIMDAKNFTFILNNMSTIKSFLKKIEEESMKIAKGGVKIPGYKLVQKHERVSFKFEQEKTVKRLMRKGFSKEQLLNTKIKSITDLKTFVPKEVINKIVTKQSSGLELVSEEDNRPSISDVESDFNDGVKG